MASKTAKRDWNYVKIVILSQNQKNRPAAGGSATPGPICDTLELYQFVQQGA